MYMNTMAMEYSCRNVKSFLVISVGLSASEGKLPNPINTPSYQ